MNWRTMITPRGPLATAMAQRSGLRRKSTISLISCLTPSWPAASAKRVVKSSVSVTLARANRAKMNSNGRHEPPRGARLAHELLLSQGL